jgi:hypothetical protein
VKSQDTIRNKIRKQQLRWFGHVKRMNPERLPKIALEGTTEGLRPRGRPRKRWIENFDRQRIAQLSRTALDRTAYRALVHQISLKGVAPRRPMRMDGT